MVQVMESWFLADVETLQHFYGNAFRSNALPRNPDIEQVAKQDVMDALERATRGTTKGRYHKGKHSFSILGQLDPSKIKSALPSGERFFESLRTLLSD